MAFQDKSPEVKAAIIAVAPNPVAFVEAKELSCGWCGNKVDPMDFTDAQSEREYHISKMCQCCQDAVFRM